jgi:large subunit ribosomal protein L29|uniref:Large ribosomal subunit protein uL29c n=1 Tax=Attheya longicornis TaxID=451786 RepID=A0A2U9NPW6_9STRA|nr:ribosomal protein L29 [Attheya longicornis]AWT39161.1 ribosomal protein L29 [Attheya longicornis]
MSLPQFNDILLLSNSEISEKILQTEKELFNLRFKRATTRQSYKSHEIKYAKRRLAQLKTLLTLRLDAIEQKRSNTINVLIKKHNYMIGNFSE